LRQVFPNLAWNTCYMHTASCYKVCGLNPGLHIKKGAALLGQLLLISGSLPPGQPQVLGSSSHPQDPPGFLGCSDIAVMDAGYLNHALHQLGIAFGQDSFGEINIIFKADTDVPS